MTVGYDPHAGPIARRSMRASTQRSVSLYLRAQVKRRTFLTAAPAALLCTTLGHAASTTYPSRPVKVIVPFPPGSGSDSLTRVITAELQQTMGQPFVIDNKPGAQTVIGSEAVARSAPDGYTLLGTAVSFAATRGLFRQLPFDPVTDFTPVSRIAHTALVLVVKRDFPASTPREFIAYAKANPGKASGGYGSASSQVCIAQLRALGGIDVIDVAYKGIPLAVNDVLAGTLTFAFADLGAAMAQVKGGSLKAIAVSSAQRNALAPDWPALSEVLPGYDIDPWNAILAPKGLPLEIAQQLHAEITKATAKPAVRAALAGIGFAPQPLGPDQMPAFIRSEVETWTKLIKQAGIQPE
jgi:tripartite-type tricarboxylate transporter receptor subunit TctC